MTASAPAVLPVVLLEFALGTPRLGELLSEVAASATAATPAVMRLHREAASSHTSAAVTRSRLGGLVSVGATSASGTSVRAPVETALADSFAGLRSLRQAVLRGCSSPPSPAAAPGMPALAAVAASGDVSVDMCATALGVAPALLVDAAHAVTVGLLDVEGWQRALRQASATAGFSPSQVEARLLALAMDGVAGLRERAGTATPAERKYAALWQPLRSVRLRIAAAMRTLAPPVSSTTVRHRYHCIITPPVTSFPPPGTKPSTGAVSPHL